MAKETKVLQPVITPTIVQIDLSLPDIAPGECIVEYTDSKGVPSTMTTTLRMWDRVYSKRQGFSLKKK